MEDPAQFLIKAVDTPPFVATHGAQLRHMHSDAPGFDGVMFTTSENPPGTDAPEHRHPYASAIVVTEGSGSFTVEEQTVAAVAGDVILIPANVWHSFRNDGDGPLCLVGWEASGHVDAELAPTSAESG